MGIDLRLLPFDTEPDDDPNSVQFSHQILKIGRDYDLYNLLERLAKDNVVPNHFSSYCGRTYDGEEGYGVTTKTAYAEPLTWLPARKLRKLIKKSGLDTPNTRTALGFLKACEPDRRIALYFH